MAVDATGFIHQRPVNPSLVQDIGQEFIMAPLAYLKTGLIKSKRGRGGGRGMALIAHFIANRRMNIIIQNCRHA